MDGSSGPDPITLHGVDIVSIDHIASLLEEFGDSFRARAFTDGERAYCEDRAYPPQHYAARWAAKEAFLKTIDEASPAVPLEAIEVDRRETGPELVLASPACEALEATLEGREACLEAADVAVSLSHDRESGYAVGSITVVTFRG
ncbi:holo-ACP synthase [Natrialbaceae archaeon A-gly3]